MKKVVPTKASPLSMGYRKPAFLSGVASLVKNACQARKLKKITYDATKNTVEYTGTNYYDADPDMTLLYGTDQSETVPTAPGSYDVYVKVTADGNYLEDHMGDKTYQVGTYVVPEPTKPTSYTLTVDGVDEPRVFDENVTVTAPEKDGYTFTGWEVTGLPADVDTTKATITFKMPANDVEISAIYNKVPTPDPDPETKTHKLNVLSAQIFLKDGSDVADLTAVPVGTELKATADEDTETSVFKNWNCTGLELTEEQSTARVVYFTMPDHDVELTAVFEVPATPDPDPTPDPKPDPTPDPAPRDVGGAIVMVAAVGGAAIGVGAYIAGTTAYLKSVLPEGMAIPANRQQLAVRCGPPQASMLPRALHCSTMWQQMPQSCRPSAGSWRPA